MVTHHTFTIERTYPVKPEAVFAVFSDPAKKTRWYADGHGVVSFEMDFRIGGSDFAKYKMKDDSPFPGVILSSETRYQDIVPNERIVTAYTMTMGDHRFSASQSTFEFIATENGTKLVFTEQGAYFENSDGPKMREGGWIKLLEGLGQCLTQI
jgi:uncharacterized protein YndB with AHSA1/START domain